MPAPRRRTSQPADPAERAGIVRSFDSCRFTLRGANDLPDTAGLRHGDRVVVTIEATVVEENRKSSREGLSEHVVVLEAYDGSVVRIIDEMVPRKRRPPKKRARKATGGGATAGDG